MSEEEYKEEIRRLKLRNTHANVGIIGVAIVFAILGGVLIYWLNDVKAELNAHKDMVDTICQTTGVNYTTCKAGYKLLLDTEKEREK